MKHTAAALSLSSVLLLAGCTGKYPAKDTNGNTWNKDWTMIGSVLGIEDPGNGFELLENPVVLTGDDTYYASWVYGEPQDYTNEDGEDTDLYDAEIYVLLYGCADEATASEAKEDWLQRQRETYSVTEEYETEVLGQSYTVIVYDCISETNPYSHGAAAFGLYGKYVYAAELDCLEEYPEDVKAVLENFLEHSHFAAE